MQYCKPRYLSITDKKYKRFRSRMNILSTVLIGYVLTDSKIRPRFAVNMLTFSNFVLSHVRQLDQRNASKT